MAKQLKPASTKKENKVAEATMVGLNDNEDLSELELFE